MKKILLLSVLICFASVGFAASNITAVTYPTALNATTLAGGYLVNFTVTNPAYSPNATLRFNVTAPAHLRFTGVGLYGTDISLCILFSGLVECNFTTNLPPGSSSWVSVNIANNTTLTNTYNATPFNINAYDNALYFVTNTSAFAADDIVPALNTSHLNVSFVAGTNSVLVSVNASDSQGTVDFFNVTVLYTHLSTIALCGANTTNNSFSTVNCSMSTLNFSGNYSGLFRVDFFVNDTAGNAFAASNIQQFEIYNAGINISSNTSYANVSQVSFGQRRANYSLPIPFYIGGPEEGRPNIATNGTEVIPFFTDRPFFATPTMQEGLAYNYTFNLNTSWLPQNNTPVNISFFVIGLTPAKIWYHNLSTIEGNISVIMFGPQRPAPNSTITENAFTVWYGGVETNVTSSSAVGSARILRGSFNNITFDGTFWLEINATANTSTDITLVFVSRPPINITEQTVTGFDPVRDQPTLGGTEQASFFINITNPNRFYSADNLSIVFTFPINATAFFTDGTNSTHVISGNVTVEEWDGTAWIAANASLLSNVTATFNVTANVLSSPDPGMNETVTIREYRYLIGNESAVSWRYNSTKALRANATLYFPPMKENNTLGRAGTNTYQVTLDMACDSGLNISSAKLPNIETAHTVIVVVNQKVLTEGVDYRLGSLEIFGASLSQGPNSISVAYSIAQAPMPGTINIGEGESQFYQTIRPNHLQEITFIRSDEHSITKLAMMLRESAANVLVDVQGVAALPTAISAAPGSVYWYTYISVSNVDEANILEANIYFRVPGTWLSQNGFEAEDVVLLRYTNNEWTELPATVIDSDSNYYFFRSASPGFSYFAIAVPEAVIPPAEDCRTLGCADGFECRLENNTYQCIRTLAEEEQPPECEELLCIGNFTLDETACECVCQLTTCPTGQELDATACACEPVVCPEGQELVDGVCQEIAVVFDATWVLVIIVIIIIAIAAIALSTRKTRHH